MIALSAFAALALLLGSGAPDPDDPTYGGLSDDSNYIVDGTSHASSDGSAHQASSSDSDGPPTQYVRAALCTSITNRSDLTPACPNGDPITRTCLDGTPADLPLWFRTQNPDGTWSDWQVLNDYTCPGDAPLLAAIRHEWAQLQPQPSDIALQPNTGWVIATVPTVAMADDAPRTHNATLLGAAVEIRATASGYRWEWGDGSHTATTDPGRPYPNATLTHTYPHASDAASVALTTTWTGQYRVNGGPWMAFDTTIASDSNPVQLTIYDPRSRLVDCDLDGQCRIVAHG